MAQENPVSVGHYVLVPSNLTVRLHSPAHTWALWTVTRELNAVLEHSCWEAKLAFSNLISVRKHLQN